MAAQSATHARPTLRGNQGVPGDPEVAYGRLSLLASTIIIGDPNDAPPTTTAPAHPQSPTLPSGTPCNNWASPNSQQDSSAHPPTTATRPAPAQPTSTRARGIHPRGVSTKQPKGTPRPRAQATDPLISTLSSPTYPHPQPPCPTTHSNPSWGSQPKTTTAPGTGITGP